MRRNKQVLHLEYENLLSLTEIFPQTDVDIVRDTLIRYEDLDFAAHVLSDDTELKMTFPGVEVSCGGESVREILKRLRNGMKSPGSAEKLKVDEEDLAVDFFQHYKTGEFDPTVPLKIQMKGQPAIDSGGVLGSHFARFSHCLPIINFLA